MAIRSKLLEVYAKRRDSKAFELLASQMFNLTRGEGEDWSKAQTLGRTIDPENVLYLPGGQPAEVRGASGQVVAEPLGASTQPYTAPVATVFQPAPDARLDQDIDLDLGEAGAPDGGTIAESPTETTQPLSTVAMRRADDTLDLSQDRADPKTIPVPRSAVSKAPPPAPADGTLDFDLEALSMDPPTVATSVTAPQSAESALDFGDFSISGEDPPEAAPVDGDPLARKLELAEEFRQIGDLEGARDLLEEVVAKAEGALRGKAQGMLDKLA
jgi:pilus assembly protein FimV